VTVQVIALAIFIFAKYYDKDVVKILNQNTELQSELIIYDKDLIFNK